MHFSDCQTIVAIIGLQSMFRSYLTKHLDTFNTRASNAFQEYESRPLLKNFPRFSQIYSRYQGTVRSFWITFNAAILHTNVKDLVRTFETDVLPKLRTNLTQMIDHMNDFLNTYDGITDANLLGRMASCYLTIWNLSTTRLLFRFECQTWES